MRASFESFKLSGSHDVRTVGMSWPIYTIKTHMRNFGRQRESNDGNSLRPGGLERWVLVPNVLLILTTC